LNTYYDVVLVDGALAGLDVALVVHDEDHDVLVEALE
jgi:hypothetical protein